MKGLTNENNFKEVVIWVNLQSEAELTTRESPIFGYLTIDGI